LRIPSSVALDDRRECSGYGERAEIVCLHLQADVVHRAGEQRRIRCDARVVDQNVDVARQGGGPADRLGICDVELDGFDAR
jgi:hypothetical protein